MKVMVLGGDGYLGWPTAMHLSSLGHEVVVVDNYLRRNCSREQDVDSLYAVPNLHERCNVWLAHSGYRVLPDIGDLTQWEYVDRLFKQHRPDTIIHYAEQPSAPYSMLSREAATLTLRNNLLTTANLIFAVRAHCPQAHIIKLGTMGEYGTPNIDIEEGWLDIEHKGRSDRFLYPRQASSLYHTTKIMDTDLLWFYVRVWGLRVTDLMQGPVYGLYTEENAGNEQLFSFFNYDEIFGTVLNRFVVQAVAGHPLTVYGKGGQTRGYLNIKDTLQCIRLSLENPAKEGELRIFNQVTEVFTVNELAQRVREAGKSLGLNVVIEAVENPRQEKETHYYCPKYTGLLDLGLKPHYLTEDVLVNLMELVGKHKANIQSHKILRNIKWAA